MRKSIHKPGFLCDLCGSAENEVKKSLNRRLGIESSKFDVVKCLNCSLLSIYPTPDESEFASSYVDYVQKKHRISVEKERLHIYINKLVKLKQYGTGKRLLDIGAGIGTFVNCAKEYGYDATGIEYNKEQCKLSKKLYGIDLVNKKFEHVCQSFFKDTFDLISMHHVLEHVQSPRNVLSKVHSILKPGGVLVIEVPNQFCNIRTEVEYLIFRRLKYPDYPLDHLYFFSIKTLKLYLKRFEILELNQFRPRRRELPLLERIPKDLYRHLFSKLNIGGSSFIEAYLRK